MALIGKIRQNFWLVLIVLGLALASFVIMDIMGSRNAGGLFNQTTVGQVGDTKIEYSDFSRAENTIFSGNTDTYGRRNAVWNYLVEKAIIDEEADDLGIGVSTEELMDLQFGTNLSPVIQNNFRNAQTGQVDRQQLLDIKKAIESGEGLNQQFREFWASQEQQIIKRAKQDKINALISKAIYTPSWMAEVGNNLNTESATFEFVKVGYDKVSNSDVQVSDDDYKNFLNKNASKYTNKEETRLVDIVVFDVLPTVQDSQKIKSELEKLAVDFRNAPNDSLFATNNNGGYSTVFNTPEQMQGILKDSVVNLEEGETFGPYLENGYYQVAKVVGKRVVADSAKARHILRSVTNNDPAQLAAANTFIDSLMNVLEAGTAEFDSLAIKHSQDPGSGFKGGDLGTFAQGTMVGPFNKVCFISGKIGSLHKVTTQFGVHLIELQDRVFDNQDPKFQMALIGKPVVPSEETQIALEERAGELMRSNRTLSALQSAVESDASLNLETSRALKENDFSVANLGSGDESRAIVKWAYQAAPGEVAPSVYTYTDKVNYFNSKYVVAALKSIQAPGLMSIEEAKVSLKDLVLNAKKAEKIKSSISGTDLNGIASQYGTVVDTAKNVSFNAGFIAGHGAEPKVVANLFSVEQGETVGPVEGNNGVYVAKMLSKNPSIAGTNVTQIKKNMNNTSRSQVNYRLWDAIKKMVGSEDNRSKFF